jgi:hypothetical protein
MMHRQPLKLCPIRCVPHIDVAIITPADQLTLTKKNG